MRRNNYIKRCKCPCNKELPSRYKGRAKIFFDGDKCRKIWGRMSEDQQAERLVEIQKAIDKEISRS